MDRTTLLLLVCCLLNHPANVLPSEPRCPNKFQYDEQLLEKMIRMEIKFEEYEKKLEQAIALFNKSKLDVDKSIVEGKNEMKALGMQIEHKHVQFEKQMDVDLQKLKNLADEAIVPNVLFRAENPTNLHNPSPIVFTRTVYNFRNGYDNGTGVFTVPVDGTYLFTMHLCSDVRKTVHYHLVVDDQAHLGGMHGSLDYNSCSSADVIVPLKTNSKVFVKSSYSGDVLYENRSDRRNIFSGVLLHK
ncbi:hypothetical protein MAR_024037 [Mya arenaria]|uniref:C1q domain-containing protein n=1 Tax=Mya arenaria TaxID=6604 RepID=A0ABY7DST3_MYAAR|nr:uncharacterized protein LOC128228327 [Mya arenaria]WAQ99664.1 hypothetical protein MAR_024037 [Mya arenaria]